HADPALKMGRATLSVGVRAIQRVDQPHRPAILCCLPFVTAQPEQSPSIAHSPIVLEQSARHFSQRAVCGPSTPMRADRILAASYGALLTDSPRIGRCRPRGA